MNEQVGMIMLGKLTAVGVGPGDPELLTLKAVKRINEADFIACPAKEGTTGVAYRIAEQVCPELACKETLLLDFPMKKEGLAEAHRKAAEEIISVLRTGKDIYLVENCGMADEKVYAGIADIPDRSGYFSILIIKDKTKEM